MLLLLDKLHGGDLGIQQRYYDDDDGIKFKRGMRTAHLPWSKTDEIAVLQELGLVDSSCGMSAQQEEEDGLEATPRKTRQRTPMSSTSVGRKRSRAESPSASMTSQSPSSSTTCLLGQQLLGTMFGFLFGGMFRTLTCGGNGDQGPCGAVAVGLSAAFAVIAASGRCASGPSQSTGSPTPRDVALSVSLFRQGISGCGGAIATAYVTMLLITPMDAMILAMASSAASFVALAFMNPEILVDNLWWSTKTDIYKAQKA